MLLALHADCSRGIGFINPTSHSRVLAFSLIPWYKAAHWNQHMASKYTKPAWMIQKLASCRITLFLVFEPPCSPLPWVAWRNLGLVSADVLADWHVSVHLCEESPAVSFRNNMKQSELSFSSTKSIRICVFLGSQCTVLDLLIADVVNLCSMVVSGFGCYVAMH